MQHISKEKVANVLDDAADYIEQHGWTRNRMQVFGRVCSVGAIAKIDMGSGGQAAQTALTGYLSDLLGEEISIVRWNDGRAKNTVEVLDTFRGAAKRLRMEEVLDGIEPVEG